MVIISSDQPRRFKLKFSVRYTILIAYIFLSILPLLFFYVTVSSYVEQRLTEYKIGQIKLFVNRAVGTIAEQKYLTDQSSAVQEAFIKDMDLRSKNSDCTIKVFDDNAIIRYDTSQTDTGKMVIHTDVLKAVDGVTPIDTVTNDGKGHKIVTVTAGITSNDSKTIGAVMFITEAKDVVEAMGDISGQMFLLLIITIVIVGMLSFFTSQIIIDPLNNILKIIQKMSDGHLNERIVIDSNNEIGRIAEAFNAMIDKLEKVDVARQEFVSNVSHELKTPLSSMKVLSESILFMENAPQEMYKEFLMDINNEIDRMTDINNDLLTLVRLDQKEIPINFKPTNINKLVQEIIKRIQPIAGNKYIKLTFESVKEVTADVDQTKLSLAISNLIENAVKYTPTDGAVSVIVNSDHQNVFISVEDTGIGIEEAEQSKIFDRFYRIDKTRDRETGGSGLGLAITQKAVLIHNGSIRVSSKENEGTTFVVRIPIHQLQV